MHLKVEVVLTQSHIHCTHYKNSYLKLFVNLQNYQDRVNYYFLFYPCIKNKFVKF